MARCLNTTKLLDVHVGGKLKILRLSSNKTLQEVGDIISVSFQQIQKYERGLNKISSSNLYLLASALDVQVEYFFEEGASGIFNSVFGVRDIKCNFGNKIEDSELLRLVKNYSKISDCNARKVILELIKSFTINH